MDNKELSGVITVALAQHRLRASVQVFHGLKDILEATGKVPTTVPNFEILLEYCSGIITSPLAEKVTLVCDPIVAHILKTELADCKTIPPELVDNIRIVTEHLIFQSSVIYVLAERRGEDTLCLVDYVPITMLDYSVARDKYCEPRKLKLMME